MAEVRVEQEIAASADAVWELLGDFGGIERWSPMAKNVQVDGTGIGAVRKIPMGDAAIHERLESHDPAARCFRYSIVESPIPFDHYLANVRVEPLAGDRCRVVWETSFASKAAPEAAMAQGLEGAYRDGLRALAKTLTEG